jgi:hypothetical protein
VPPTTTPPHRRRRDDRGTTSGTFAALGVGTLAFVALLNVITYQVGRGAARTAVDQAARAGAIASGSPAVCEERAREGLDALLGGPLGDGITVTCTDDGQHVEATAAGTFRGWVGPVPDWTWTVTATATREQAP